MAQMSGLAYVCSTGETFDSVALAVYDDEKYACDLMNANPALVGTSCFAGGEKLALPVVRRTTDGQGNSLNAAPWKE